MKSTILRRFMGTISRVNTNANVAALTFDDGPGPKTTPKVLEILESHNTLATFFMVGKLAEANRSLVKRVHLEGHAIGCHSWDHSSFPLLTFRQRRSQIRAFEKAISGYGERLFRPPFGHQSPASRFDLLRLGYKVITWDVVAEDWLDHDPEWMVEKVINNIKPGSVVLLHDWLYTFSNDRFVSREPMLKALDMLLGRLDDKIKFVTIPQLLRYGSAHYRNWYPTQSSEWVKQFEVTKVSGM